MSNEMHAEAGYLVWKVREGEWIVYKMDLSTGEPVIEGRHTVRDGVCDCEGFKHRKDCRHIKLIYEKPTGVDRATARADAAEIINSWQDRFDRMTFDDYVFMDAEETLVKCVKIIAQGRPIEFDGKSFTKITGITRAGTFVEVSIG